MMGPREGVMKKTAKRPVTLVRDMRGGLRLIADGVGGVTGLVESLHGRISRLSPPLGLVAEAPMRGITGLVYRGIRGSTDLIGASLDGLLARIEAGLPQDRQFEPEAEPRREALLAALNGVLGDHLQRSGNPLALTMALRFQGSGPKPLVLIHGLCMNDRQWLREGHDHGQSLADALGFTPIYARYNSGLHICANGLALAEALQRLLQRWPEPVEELTMIGHSMGGLVARSAVYQATQRGMAWPQQLRRLVFLGSPHHGAPLERAGNWLHQSLGLSPYLAPFTRLSGLRSAGITDLRHGNLLEADWAGASRFAGRDRRLPLPLPKGVACYAMAGTLGRSDGGWLGDGLVPLDSALGRHPLPSHRLRIPAARQWVARGAHHLDLLGSPAVYERLRRWLDTSLG
jgi:pimeloyl-ACP methyl ester carboxylesterase